MDSASSSPSVATGLQLISWSPVYEKIVMLKLGIDDGSIIHIQVNLFQVIGE